MDIDNKLHNYLKITGIINNVFRPQKTLKKTRIKLYVSSFRRIVVMIAILLGISPVSACC